MTSRKSCNWTRQHASPHSTERFRSRNLSKALDHPLDRVNVLDGHTGCVNALSWARDGELLLSGGDDTTVRIWAIDASNSQEYPFVCRSVIQTGHRANIFSAHMLPYSSRIATVAGDKQVRILDIGEEGLNGSSNGRETTYSPRQSCKHILRCHGDRVKRIVTEYSPDLFLSVGEDGTVRQHDLRTPHDCRNGTCPTPLVKISHELSALALSPLTPYQFVVAGESPYGYLFDRRHAGRFLQEEWGVVPQARENDYLTNCVRRFGRRKKATEGRGLRSEHITGARMSAHNGHEVILSYSGDAVYLYSTNDDPEGEESASTSTSSLLTSNLKRRKIDEADTTKLTGPLDTFSMDIEDHTSFAAMEMDSNMSNVTERGDDGEDDEDDDNLNDGGDEEEAAYIEFSNLDDVEEEDLFPNVPVIHPRQRYAGARNVMTIKDVNFLGPSDEFIASGSDDGNFFVWRKTTGTLHGIYEGDSSVVNMIEGHPHLPLVAISGIDTTVKLFAPSNRPSGFSRMENAQRIIDSNTRMGRRRSMRYNFAALVAEARMAMGAEEAIGIPECRNQ